MNTTANYQELCAKMGLPASRSLLAIWEILLTPEEASLAVLLPGTVTDIAVKAGMSAAEAAPVIASMYRKGAVFKSSFDELPSFKLAKNIVQFHDASLLWNGATQEFLDHWKKVMDEDFAALMRGLPETVKLPSFMRVIPVDATIALQSGVLPYEACAEMVNRAEVLAVVPCPCRLSQKNCASPLETCIQMNRGARYALDRGHGRSITRDEALGILRKSEEAGLVHMVENRGFGNAICNCCSCCCEMFRLVKNSGKQWILAPSRYLAAIDESGCSFCGLCVERCPVNAIAVDCAARVESSACVGCGCCIDSCPEKAISLRQVRPAEHIPSK